MCWENNSTVYNVYEYNSKHIYSFCPIDYKSCFKLLNNKTLERKSRENWQGGWPLEKVKNRICAINNQTFWIEYWFTNIRVKPDSPRIFEVCVLSHVWLFITPCTVVLQAPLSMEFSRQRYWNRLPFPTPGDLPNTGIKAASCIDRQILTICHLWSPIWHVSFPNSMTS